MEYAGALPLLPAFCARLGWEFVVPEGVLAELARLRMPPEIEAFLKDGTMRAGRCNVGRTVLPRDRLEGLGMGEAEAICIVGECEDRTFRGYVILTDDKPARTRARSLGMKSHDSMEFLLTANRAGLATAGKATAALESLEASGYRPRGGARGRFIRGLR